MFYIKKVKLDSYKTLQKFEANLNPGLNIIIGKNGTGKSNFLNFLFDLLKLNNLNSYKISSSITFFDEEKKINWEFSINNTLTIETEEEGLIIISNENLSITLKNNLREFITAKNVDDFERRIDKAFYLNSIFIRHGIPINYHIVDKPIDFQLQPNNKFFGELLNSINDSNRTSFSRGFLINLLFNFWGMDKPNLSDSGKEIEYIFKDSLNYIEILKEPLARFSMIKDIRFSEKYKTSYDEEKEEYTIENLFLEFLVNEKWHTFSHLSDGTKRLFYIVSEISAPSNFFVSRNKIGLNKLNYPTIYLLEEPELGLHPQSLENILLFIKEHSAEKQFIITTHSPQVLDILNKNELNKILISRLENGKTKIHSLTSTQIKKATDYLDSEAFLSDYWRFSDLEV